MNFIDELVEDKTTHAKVKTYTYDEVKKAALEYFNGDELATSTWISKYAMKNENQQYVELAPNDMHRRLAKEFAIIETYFDKNIKEINGLSIYGKNREKLTEERIFELFKNFNGIIPQGSVMSVLGNPYVIGSLSNCIVLPELFDSYGGIMYADQQLVQLFKRRCGCGVDISTLRPAGMIVQNAAGTTSGAISFMERFSNTTREVAQNGRRGALMITIDINHPDVEYFVTIKQDLSKVTGANISLKLRDDFMKAVQNDEEYILRFPVESTPEDAKYTKVIKAKELWDIIVKCAHNTAEPGLIFWDKQHTYSTSSFYPEFRNISTNPSLRYDTMILTNEGVRKIGELASETPNIIVKNIKGEFKDAFVFKSGLNKQLYKILFNNGQSVFCTPEHKWPILNSNYSYINGDGKVNKKETKNLSIGDKIQINDDNNPINFNDKLTKNEGFVTGWNMGDGWRGIRKKNGDIHYGFIFSNEDVNNGISNNVLGFVNNLILCGVKNQQCNLRNNKGCFEFTTSNDIVINFFENIGYKGKEYGLPNSIWVSNHNFISGIIDGLFSSDGCVSYKRKNIILTSKHKKLLTDVQKLLMFYGIRSSIRYSESYSSFPNDKFNNLKKYGRYDLTITSLQARKFASIFTLSSLKKQLELSKLKNCTSQKSHCFSNFNKIKEVILTDIFEDVYDIKVFDDTATFVTEVGVTGNCSEIAMNNDSCRLIANNMFSCVENPYTKKAKFNFDKWYELNYEAQRLMDDLVELELKAIERILAKIAIDPEPLSIKQVEIDTWKSLYKTGKDGRRTGLGITALGDTLAALGFTYDSNEALKFVDKAIKKKCEAEWDSSIDMAIERGKFECFDNQIEEQSEFIQMMKKDLPEQYKRNKEYGRRNISISTVAPTGSLSMLSTLGNGYFNVTSGIEPMFNVEKGVCWYVRRKKINPNDKNVRVDFVDELGDSWQEFRVFHSGFKYWVNVNYPEIDLQNSSMDEIKEIFKTSPYFGSGASEIDWIKRVEIQSIIQKYITHSISSTINLPNEVQLSTVSDIYFESWKKGLKGITVYRDGSRNGVLISDNKKKTFDKIDKTTAPKRPKTLDCDIYQIVVEGKPWLVIVGLLENNPYEVFAFKKKNISLPNKIKTGQLTRAKSGRYDLEIDGFVLEDIKTHFENHEHEALTRMISTALRHGADINFIYQQLQKSEGNIVSISKAISRTLKKYLDENEVKETFESCPNNNEGCNIVREEGCVKCLKLQYF